MKNRNERDSRSGVWKFRHAIARTPTDLEARGHISEQHIGEAIQYRSLDRQYFFT